MTKTAKPSEPRRVVGASEFKAACLDLLDEVTRTGESIVITRKGEPIAELLPHKRPKPNARGIWKGKVEIVGDIISPVDVAWDALK